MKLAYMLRLVAIATATGLVLVVGCGGANSSDLLDTNPSNSSNSGSDGGGDGGGSSGDSGGGGGDDSGNPQPGDDSGSGPGIRCDDGSTTAPTKTCSPDATQCCIGTDLFGNPVYDCTARGTNNCNGIAVECNRDLDCPEGDRCCEHLSNNRLASITCDSVDTCAVHHICDTRADCSSNETCTGKISGYAYHYCR